MKAFQSILKALQSNRAGRLRFFCFKCKICIKSTDHKIQNTAVFGKISKYKIPKFGEKSTKYKIPQEIFCTTPTSA